MRHPPTDPAFPIGNGQLGSIGLTKREHFSALILAGMCANSDISQEVHAEELVRQAIGQADLLIQALAIQKDDPIDPDDKAMDELRAEYYSGKPRSVEVSADLAMDQIAALAR